MHTLTHTHICLYMPIAIRTDKQTYAYQCLYTHRQLHTWCIYIYIYTYTRLTCTLKCVHTYVNIKRHVHHTYILRYYMSTYTYIQTYIHTSTDRQSDNQTEHACTQTQNKCSDTVHTLDTVYDITLRALHSQTRFPHVRLTEWMSTYEHKRFQEHAANPKAPQTRAPPKPPKDPEPYINPVYTCVYIYKP